MFEDTEYHKIPGPFKRAISGLNKNKLIAWDWAKPEFELLKDIPWSFTEKIDGTNIRLLWDGYNLEIRGRTNNATLAPDLIKNISEMFPEELLEQTFGVNPVVLYGEGYGPGIQKGGGNYRDDKSFILFDVHIDGWWLLFESVEDIANSLGISVVPVIFTGTLTEAVKFMAEGEELYSIVAEKYGTVAEGVVGTPAVPLFNRKGERIIVKLKGRDLHGLDLDNPIVVE